MIVEFRPVEATEANGLIGETNIRAWLTAGQHYAVQSVSTRHGIGVRFLVEPGDGGPGWWRAANFHLIDPTIPSSWTAALDEDGDMHLEPAAWREPGFWVDFHDDVPAALATYAAHRQTLTR